MFDTAKGKIIDSKGKQIFSKLLENEEKLTKLKEFEF